MATNKIQRGDRLTVVAPANVVSGQPLLVGAIFGICQTDAVAADTVVIDTEGVFELPKAAGAVTQGQKIYWDDVAKNVTTVVSANQRIGSATQAQLTGDATAQVAVTPF